MNFLRYGMCVLSVCSFWYARGSYWCQRISSANNHQRSSHMATYEWLYHIWSRVYRNSTRNVTSNSVFCSSLPRKRNPRCHSASVLVWFVSNVHRVCPLFTCVGIYEHLWHKPFYAAALLKKNIIESTKKRIRLHRNRTRVLPLRRSSQPRNYSHHI